MKPRLTLKSYFTKGAIPSETDFSELIDSMIIQDDDLVFKPATGPLSIKATGDDEALLDFYRAEQGNTSPTWQLKQKPAGAKPGLSIGESTATHLYIEGGSGNVGIGTTTIPNVKKWDKVVDILGTTNARLSVRSEKGGVVTFVAGHDTWGGPAGQGVIGTESNHALYFATNYQHRMKIDTNGNVGIGTIDPKATLTVSGDLIRRVSIATGLGPVDDTDNGQIKTRVLSFTKQYADTAIRILYCDNFRVWNNVNNPVGAAARWEIRIDKEPVPGGAIYQDMYVSTGNFHKPATILGYAQGVTAGNHEIQVWVGPIGLYPIEAYTGWNQARWTLEAQEVWLK